jgi:hypothetical protein
MRFARKPMVAGLLLALTAFAAPRAGRAQAAPVTPAFDFSGVIYANFQRRTDDATKAANGGNAGSKFDLDRVYLNFRMPAGDRASIRVTTDVFNSADQSGTSYYKGWTARLKYAYLQWNFANDIGGAKGLNATARFGMLQTVVVEHEEQYSPRYLSQTDLERTAGFFSSADLGAAVLVTLPKKMGEVYANVVNGPGYSAAEADRFKDPGVRLTLTPFANGNAIGAWGKTLVISPWVYSGKTASKFQNGGTGQVGSVSDGLKRNRYGLFIATRDPRLTVGVNYGKRTETTEQGDNTVASPRATTDVSGRVMSGFVMIKPAAFKNPASQAAKWGLFARLDSFKPNTDAEPSNQFSIISLFWEPTAKVTFSLDSQNLTRKNGSTTPESKGLFFHIQALF